MTSMDAPLPVPFRSVLARGLGRLVPRVERRAGVVGWVLVTGLLLLVLNELGETHVIDPYSQWMAPWWAAQVREALPWVADAFVGIVLAGHVLAVAALPLA